MATNEGIEFPKLIDEEEVDWTTRPTPLHELPPAERMGLALGVLESQHKRIFTAITSIWGHKECSCYGGPDHERRQARPRPHRL
jgi:hypothetical protein